MTCRLILVLALLTALQEARADGWYLSVAGGISRVDASALKRGYGQDASRYGDLSSRDITSAYFNQANGAWKASAGWKASKFVAAELSYSDYGAQRLGYHGTHRTCCGSLLPEPSETRDAQRGVTAWGVDLIGNLPLGADVEGIAGIGAARVQTKLSALVNSNLWGTDMKLPTSVSDQSSAARFMVGVKWSPFHPWAVRISYEYLSKVGSTFESDGRGDHTGRSWQQTIWAGVQRDF
jgi:opacity protein-like surface antigen